MKIISLGLGVQSTALYYMSSMGELPRADYAVFADTGGEKTETLEYLQFLIEWKEANNGIPIIVMNEVDLERDLLEGHNLIGHRMASIPAFTKDGEGKEGMLRRQCTSEYKIKQVDTAIRRLYGYAPRKRLPQTEIWNGITLDEMQRMRTPSQKWKIMVYPFCGYSTYPDGKSLKNDYQMMRRGDVSLWYMKHNLPIPEKSSCVFCPFQSDVNWIRLKTRKPGDFARAIQVDAQIRDSSKRGVTQPIFVHRSLKPLSEVHFDESQTEMWGDCYGYCHI